MQRASIKSRGRPHKLCGTDTDIRVQVKAIDVNPPQILHSVQGPQAVHNVQVKRGGTYWGGG